MRKPYECSFTNPEVSAIGSREIAKEPRRIIWNNKRIFYLSKKKRRQTGCHGDNLSNSFNNF